MQSIPPEGQGAGAPGELSRSDMRLIRHAARQDWPIPPAVQAKILQRLVDYLDRDHEEGQTATDRVVIAAARTIAGFGALALKQQALDLARERMEAGRPEGAATVADAMKLVEKVERALGAGDGASGEDPPGR